MMLIRPLALFLLTLVSYGLVPLPLIPDFKSAAGWSPQTLEMYPGAQLVFAVMRMAETVDPSCIPVFVSHEDGALISSGSRNEYFLLQIVAKESDTYHDQEAEAACTGARTWVFVEDALVLSFQYPQSEREANLSIPIMGMGPQRIRAVILTKNGEVAAVDVNVIAVVQQQPHEVDVELSKTYGNECAHGDPVLMLRRVESVLLSRPFYVLEPNASQAHQQPVHVLDACVPSPRSWLLNRLQLASADQPRRTQPAITDPKRWRAVASRGGPGFYV